MLIGFGISALPIKEILRSPIANVRLPTRHNRYKNSYNSYHDLGYFTGIFAYLHKCHFAGIAKIRSLQYHSATA